MSEAPATPKPSFVERLSTLPRQALYATLVVVTTIPLFFPMTVPKKAPPQSAALYRTLVGLPEGSTIILQSDFTKSTRGESMGQLEAILRILMERKIKFVLLSVADPQAPQVARDVIKRVNAERKKESKSEYQKWTDYVDIGYFPSGEALAKAMANNVKTAWGGKMDGPAGGQRQPIFNSPILQNINSVSDFSLLLNITGSKTIDIINERLGDKVTVAAAVTGVMGPESLNYFKSGQIKGLGIGLAGAVDLEMMMVMGTDPEGKDGRMEAPGQRTDPLPGAKPARGMSYYLSLHAAMVVMILAVVIGNLGMMMARKGGKK